jgi:DNA topoisomerase-2
LVSKLYDKDRPLCKGQEFEGNMIEPAYYVPVFPTLFLNGSDGISTGYKQTIFPRNPKEIVKYIVAVLNKSERIPHIENALPWFKGFLGETKLVKEKDADGKVTAKVMNYGVVEKVNSNTLHISEIPITYTYASYIKVLDNLVEKGTIEDYEDLSDPKTDKFEFTIKVKRVFFESNSDVDSWIKVFNLAKPLNEQLNCIDENNRIREFNNIKEILDAFIKIRLEYYQKRKDYLLKKYMEEIQLDVSKYVWCKGVIDETIHIKNKKKDDIVKQLEKTDKIIQKDGSYNYLLNMPMSSITKEKMSELTEKIKNLKELIKETQKQTIEQMWLSDLDEIGKEF